MSIENSSQADPVDEFINIGSAITGNLASSVIGLLVAGPPGMIAGGLASPLLTRLFQVAGQDLKNRVLSRREEVRVGATLTFAIQKIQENFLNGQHLRQDDFFNERLHERAAADEVLEGVLISAQREYEEKKLQFYGNLLANIAFQQEIDRQQANLLIKLGATISYCQMCILGLVANKEAFTLREEDYVFEGDDGQIHFSELSLSETSVLQEIYDLYLKRLLEFHIDGVIFGKPIGDLEYIKPQTLELKPTGLKLYELMELNQVSEDDVKRIAQILSARAS